MSSSDNRPGPFLHFGTILFCGFLYACLFYINDWLTQLLQAAPGVNWIYLPAGLRLFLVLIFGLPGALGIVAASTIITFYRDFGIDPLTIIGIGLISGLAPYLARYLVIRNLKIATDLGNLNIQTIFLCILIFATLSATFHQVWFEFRGFESGSLKNTLIMLIGDVLGSLLLISLVKVGIDFYKKFSKKQSLL
ncbi:hypothetical protein MCEREM21_00413 [Burkholderiaceae bacterium]